jgi:hypothetical protein
MTLTTKFRELEARAKSYLSRPLEAAPLVGVSRASAFVLIWRYPAFEPYRSWALLQGWAGNDEVWLVRRTTWDRPVDYLRAADPSKQAALMADPDPAPTVEVLDARTSGDLAQELLRRVGELTITSLLVSDSIFLDGVVNGIETQHGQVHLEWWCEGPPAWRRLAEEVERIRIELERVVVCSSTEP